MNKSDNDRLNEPCLNKACDVINIAMNINNKSVKKRNKTNNDV